MRHDAQANRQIGPLLDLLQAISRSRPS
jgi:hypothetical protein